MLQHRATANAGYSIWCLPQICQEVLAFLLVTYRLHSALQRHVHSEHRPLQPSEPAAAQEVDFVAEREFWKRLLAADPVFQQQVSCR